MKFLAGLDTPGGHLLLCAFIFVVGAGLYVGHFDYGKEIMTGALASLWTAIRIRGGDNYQPQVVNQAETITVTNPNERHSS